MFMCLSCVTFAQNIITFTATSYAVANVNTRTGYYSWSDWERCNVHIVFDLVNDVITIYSNSPQQYRILTNGENIYDKDGGEQVKYKVIDQDNDRGTLRLRVERNGNSQLYVDFNNVAWCYNVTRNY